jgi:hypothetical protein
MMTRMLQRVMLCGLVGVMLGPVLGLESNVQGQRIWVFERVDDAHSNDQALALDSQDRPHLCYFDSQAGDLQYARFDGQQWQRQRVDSEGFVGGGCKLAVDSADRPHMSYYDGMNRDLKYAHFDGQAWQVQTVESMGDAGFDSSIAVDAQRWPHIAYTSSQGLKYAHWDGQQWQFDVVENTGGGIPSLALATNGRPHIAYLVDTEAGLHNPAKYAHWDGTQWYHEVIPDSAPAWDLTLRLDGADQPHLLYYSTASPAQVRYVVRSQGQWVWQRLPKPPGCGQSCRVSGYSRLEMDAQGRPHVTYLVSGGRLFFGLIYGLQLQPGQWQQETVVELAMPLLDIAVNHQGKARISYLYAGSQGPCAGDGLCYAQAQWSSGARRLP